MSLRCWKSLFTTPHTNVLLLSLCAKEGDLELNPSWHHEIDTSTFANGHGPDLSEHLYVGYWSHRVLASALVTVNVFYCFRHSHSYSASDPDQSSLIWMEISPMVPLALPPFV